MDWLQHDKPDNSISGFNALSPHDYFILIVFLLCVLVIFLLRNNTYFWWLWKCFKWMFVIFLAVLFADYIKKELKDWWSEK